MLPFVHRRGLGTALLQRAEALAAEAGLGMLSLYASNNSVPFYLLNGYRALGDAAMPLNRHISARCQLMRKHLCAGFAEDDASASRISKQSNPLPESSLKTPTRAFRLLWFGRQANIIKSVIQ